ncbi:aldo/keto reductase [Actinomadura monticuli]|uniref:Aldo/keto reductase n=1 Tax=Actinomadura monticuli TaxID=3097367 RepID=A0ABV4QGJ2_9ACTN
MMFGSAGESEGVVGKAIEGRRDDIVLASKFFFPLGEERNARDGSRRYIVRAVEDSLRRLGTDRIDLYQMHRPAWDTDLEETLDALTDLVRQGKVLYAASSSFPADQIVEAQWAAARRGGAGSCASSRSTRSSPGRSRSRCCPPRGGTGWASSRGARSPAAG